MNFKKKVAVAAAFTVLTIPAVSVCQDHPAIGPAPPDVQRAVLARLTEIQNAAEALDPDKVFSYVMENDNGALAQNGRLYFTRRDALESTRQGLQGLKKVSYRFDKQSVTLLSPTVALAVGEGESSATLDDGRTLNAHFVQSVVFVLTDGGWKVFHSHRSFPGAG